MPLPFFQQCNYSNTFIILSQQSLSVNTFSKNRIQTNTTTTKRFHATFYHSSGTNRSTREGYQETAHIRRYCWFQIDIVYQWAFTSAYNLHENPLYRPIMSVLDQRDRPIYQDKFPSHSHNAILYLATASLAISIIQLSFLPTI